MDDATTFISAFSSGFVAARVASIRITGSGPDCAAVDCDAGIAEAWVGEGPATFGEDIDGFTGRPGEGFSCFTSLTGV